MKAIISLIMLSISLLIPSSAIADMSYTQAAAVQWIIKETAMKTSPDTAKRIVRAVYNEASKHDIDPLFILSLIRQESNFKPTARSSAGARGLTQVMPRWHKDKIGKRNVKHIETNIEIGTQILADCLNKHNAVVNKALRCYSGGAKNYAKKLKNNHKNLKRQDILYRFTHELPQRQYAQFNKPFLYPNAVNSKQLVATLQ